MEFHNILHTYVYIYNYVKRHLGNYQATIHIFPSKIAIFLPKKPSQPQEQPCMNRRKYNPKVRTTFGHIVRFSGRAFSQSTNRR